MSEEMELLIMNLIVNAGSCRSTSMEAIAHAKAGRIDEAREALARAEEEMGGTHNAQTELIQNEARGNRTEVNLLLVHAQDHIMTAMVVKDLATEIVDLYARINGEH